MLKVWTASVLDNSASLAEAFKYCTLSKSKAMPCSSLYYFHAGDECSFYLLKILFSPPKFLM